jgi:ribosome-binding factor A
MTERRRYPRTARLNELVREVLADEIERIEDSRLGFLTVTGCEVSRDLRQAVVYYSVLGNDELRESTAEALRAATPHLKVVLGRSVRMKYTPDLIFREDPAVATGARVEEIIRSLGTGDSDEGGEAT